MRNKRPLGRIEPKEFDHVAKYPARLLMATPAAVWKPTPVVLGIPWMANFDTPVKGKDGKWRIGKGNLGPVRGGHAICAAHDDSYRYSWMLFYNQLKEGACVLFAESIQMTMLNLKKYNAMEMYPIAQANDEWAPAPHEGTSLKAGYDIWRERGPVCYGQSAPCLEDGISANRWAADGDEILAALGNPKYIKSGEIPLHNTWGLDYPFRTWIPIELVDRMIRTMGAEAGIITDR